MREKEQNYVIKTFEEASALAAEIAAVQPGNRRLRLGLNEIFINAIEHGSLGLGNQFKSELKDNGEWHMEVAKRQKQKPYSDRCVHVKLVQDDDYYTVSVKDEGDGFDWKNHMSNMKALANGRKSGRGIMLAQKAGFDHMEYMGKGNHVVCRVKRQTGA